MLNASMHLNSKLPWLLLACCWLLVPLSSRSQATTDIVDTGGFESASGFDLGPLLGQEGWQTNGAGLGTATVQNTMVESGSQAVEVYRGVLSDDRWAVPVGNLGFPRNRFILIDWDMSVISTGATSGTGPYFGVEAYDDTDSFNVLGSLGVNATTGDVLYQAPATGVLTPTGAMVTLGQWHHFQIKLDFALDQYQVLLDGVPLISTAFVDGPSNVFTDADIAALSANVDGISQNLTGTAFFDNFLVRDVAQGDFDIDGDVDDVDLSIWKGAFGTTVGAAADADFDGDSDGADFLSWQRDFDNGAGFLTATVSVVPEPSGFTLVLLALGFSSRRRCRCR